MNPGIICKKEKMQQKKSNFDFRNVKSNFILKKIFDIMKKNKSLLIVKYNKEIQNRLNISTKDYKEYCQIEIELKLVDNKYGKFINISNEDKEYYVRRMFFIKRIKYF